MKTKLITILILILLLAPATIHAQVSTGQGLWKYVSGLLQPVLSTFPVYSPDDFRFDDEILPDGDLCSNGQILKKTGADDWDCAEDNSTDSAALGTTTPWTIGELVEVASDNTAKSTSTPTVTSLTAGLMKLFNPTGSVGAIAQVDNANTTNFALAQQSNGHTHINAVGSAGIGFHLDGDVTHLADLDYSGWDFGTSTQVSSGDFFVDTNTLYVDSSNNRVGIGTSTPDNDLVIDATNPSIILNGDSGQNKAIDFETDDTIAWRLFELGSTGDFRLNRYNTSGVFQDVDLTVQRSDGWFGMGTTTPKAKLHVRSGSAGSGVDWGIGGQNQVDDLVIEGNSHTGISIVGGGDEFSKRIVFGDEDSNIFDARIEVASGEMRFYNNGSRRITIDDAGNVGINDTTPNTLFHVSESSPGLPGISGRNVAIFERSGNAAIAIITGNTSDSSVEFGDPEDENAGAVSYDHNTDQLTLVAGATTRGTFDSSGLAVVGDFTATGGVKGGINLTIGEATLYEDGTALGAYRDYSQKRDYLVFDGSTETCAQWSFVMPDTYSTSFDLYADVIYTMATSTSGTIEYTHQIMANADGEVLETNSFDTANAISATVPGTAGQQDTLTDTLTNKDSVNPGELVIYQLCRDADDGTNDTSTGLSETAGINLRWD